MEQLELGPLRCHPGSGSSEKAPERALEVWMGEQRRVRVALQLGSYCGLARTGWYSRSCARLCQVISK